jgi:transposase-like protein
MGKRRTFTADFKFEAVLDMVRGEKTVAQICRERDITESLLYTWRDAFLERAPAIFADGRRGSNGNDPQVERIAELERMVGKLTMEIEVLKKARSLLSSTPKPNGRSLSS